MDYPDEVAVLRFPLSPLCGLLCKLNIMDTTVGVVNRPVTVPSMFYLKMSRLSRSSGLILFICYVYQENTDEALRVQRSGMTFRKLVLL